MQEKREIVKSIDSYNNTFYGAVIWNVDNKIGQHQLQVFDPNAIYSDRIEANNLIEALYKKWLMGEDFAFPAITQLKQWNSIEKLEIDVFTNIERNIYLQNQAKKLLRNYFSTNLKNSFVTKIEEVDIKTMPADDIYNQWKSLDDDIKSASLKGKIAQKEEGFNTEGLLVEDSFELREKMNLLFNAYKDKKENASFDNYNTIAPQIEAALVMSANDTNFKDTRTELITLQKELFAMPMERWQKNELAARMQECFSVINKRQDEYRATQDQVFSHNYEKLKAQFDKEIPEVLESNFDLGFGKLKQLQELHKVAKLGKAEREELYQQLNQTFEKIKEKAETESKTNEIIAQQELSISLEAYKNTELFKDKRAVLIDLQNRIKEIRLSRTFKDKIFGEIRILFEQLNTEQDLYIKGKKEERGGKIEDILLSLQSVLARKKDGMQRLYDTKLGLADKIQMFKPTNKPNETGIKAQFEQRLEELTSKIDTAEKDILKLESRVAELQETLKSIKAK